jgi:hypothetical protein
MARAKKTKAAVPAVPTESKITPDDPHYNIPRDANGDPVYLILPDDIRRSYARYMLSCEAGWRETGDPAFVAEAQTWTHYHRQPIPAWLHEAVWALALRRRGRAHAARAKAAAIRLMRYQVVRDAQRRGLTWEAAYVHAADVLKQTNARGEPDTMKAAYITVKMDLKAGRHGLYSTPKLPRKKLGDAPKHAASPRIRVKR